jgi:hypothetical protein
MCKYFWLLWAGILWLSLSANTQARIRSAQIHMTVEELQSTCVQIQQQVTKIPGALLENFLLQQNPSENPPGIQRVIMQNSTQVFETQQALSTQVALDESESVNTPSTSIRRSQMETEQSKLFFRIC